MPEPVDMIMPILQRIQTDVAGLKDNFTSLDARVARLETRVESIDNTITFALGLETRNKREIDAIKKRMDAVEAELQGS